jgi:4-amino-4-deoxy-L-arabinose transferase-like glycosyltransferase
LDRSVLVAAVLCVAFLIGSFVWLDLDHSVPVYDSGMHMWLSLSIRDAFADGHLGYWFSGFNNYPPLVHVVGAFGLLIGGLNPTAPIVASLLVFVPLLVAGCYITGRLAYGRGAGALAILFALGSPMLVAQLHTFMLDAPEAALVAASVAALLTSDRFRRTRVCVLAGVLCGLGLMTKQSFVAYVIGLVAVMLVRGGWRERRGLAAFVLPVMIVAGPWYLYHLHQIGGLIVNMANSAGTTSTTAGSPYPPRFSVQNLTFYWWSAVNLQFVIPLCLFAIVGTAASVLRFVRAGGPDDYTPELVVGALVGWLGMTWQAVHDPRYMLPATVYVAVLGVGWIGRLSRRGTIAAAGLLAVIAVVNTLGDSFGVGRPLAIQVGAEHPFSELENGQLTFYSAYGYEGVSAPRRQPDLLPILERMESRGIRRVVGYSIPGFEDFSAAGLIALDDFARLGSTSSVSLNRLTAADAFVIHSAGATVRGQRPCVRLYDGTGVWFTRGNPFARVAKFVCPR